MQECKRQLNNEMPAVDASRGQHSVQAVTVQMRMTGTDTDGVIQPGIIKEDSDEEIVIEDVQACTSSTNTADDYAHRGIKLQCMPFYVYRMYVRRIRKPGLKGSLNPTLFHFTSHYALSRSYTQEVILTNINIPTIDGFQCPTWTQDPKQNSLLKAILFTPWACVDPMTCGEVSVYKHMASACNCSEEAVGAPQPAASPAVPMFTF